MKIRHFILGALACGMFAACTSEDPVGPQGPDNGNGVGYLAVNIVAPKDNGSRTAMDGGFVSGDNTENKVEKGLFLLFNADGTQYANSPQLINLEFGNIGNYDHEVERIANAVLVIGTEEAGVNEIKATKILAIMNPTVDVQGSGDNTNDRRLEQILRGKTLTEVLSVINSFDDRNNQNFVMTNSTYLENGEDGKPTGNPIQAADIAGHIATSPESAKLNPVEIYVERVLAKVHMNKPSDIDCKLSTIDISNGTTTITGKSLKPVITGVELANRAKTVRLFKSISDWNSWEFTWAWNDPANKRSYWANVPNNGGVDQDWYNRNYQEIVDLNKIGNAVDAYCHPNTSSEYITSVLVTAQIMEQDENGEYTQPFEFVKYAGDFYTKEGALAIIANTLHNAGYRIKENNTLSDIPATDLKWIGSRSETTAELEGWEAVAVLQNTTGKTYVNVNEDKVEGEYKVYTADQINTKLAQKAYRVWIWTKGKCYYFVNIEHFGTNKQGEPLKGIIRNHVYNLNLLDLNGLGVPVFDPSETIIPDTPSPDQFYLAARINILKWKIVSQDIHFEN